MGLSLKSDYTIDVSYLSDIYFIYLIFLARLISTSRVDDICQSKFYMGVEFTLAIEERFKKQGKPSGYLYVSPYILTEDNAAR